MVKMLFHLKGKPVIIDMIHARRLPEMRPKGWTFPDDRTRNDIAAMVVLNGTPFREYSLVDGDVESGHSVGVRWGQLKVIGTMQGAFFLIRKNKGFYVDTPRALFHNLSREGTIAGLFHSRQLKWWVPFT